MKINYPFKKELRKTYARNILDLLIKATYLLAIFLIPLWFAYFFPTYHIFELNKLVVFKILTLLLLFFTSFKIVFYSQISFLKIINIFKKYWLIPAIFISGLSLTLLKSSNPLLSFYGISERQGGLISYLFYFLWFILLTFNLLSLKSKKYLSSREAVYRNIKEVLFVITCSSFLVSTYAILQILNIDFLTWPEAPWLTHRAFSSFGQPNFLASWLLLVIPLSFYQFFKSQKFFNKFFYLFTTVLELIALFLTGSRGGLLGLLFAAILYLIYLLITSSWSKFKKLLVIVLFFVLSLASLGVLNYSSQGRVQELGNFNYGSLGARFNFYRAASQAFVSEPIWGYGLENSGQVFIKYYRPDWAVYGDVGQNTDRAHNIILDILLTTGIFGLILFGLYYYYFFNLVQNNIKNNWQKNLSLALALGASAYLFSLLFSFSIVSTEIYFCLFLAILVVINLVNNTSGKNKEIFYQENIQSAEKNQKKLVLKFFIIFIIAFLIFKQISLNFKELVADYYFRQINLSFYTKEYSQIFVLDNYLLAEKPNPINLENYYLFLGDNLDRAFPEVQDLILKSVFRRKLQIIDNNLSDKNYRNLLVKAKINLDLNNYSRAQKYISKLISKNPFWPQAYLEQAKIYIAQKEVKKALEAYYLADLNLPQVTDSRLNLEHRQEVSSYKYFISQEIAKIYESKKNYLAAIKYYKLAYYYNPAQFTLLKKIGDNYYKNGDFYSALKYIIHGKNRNPQDYHWSYALAILYFENNNYELAQDYLHRALKLAPSDKALLSFQKKVIEYKKD